MAIEAKFYPEYLGVPLYGLQELMVNNNNNNAIFGFQADSCFGFQEIHQNQNLFSQQNHGLQSSSSPSSSSAFDHLYMQKQELDSLLQLQKERLKSAIQEQRRQQLSVLLKTMESKAMSLVEQKEEDLLKAKNRNKELEDCLRKAQTESETWRGLAREYEAIATSLSKNLERVKQSMKMSSELGQDSESIYCGSCAKNSKKEEEEEKVVCKGCNSRASSCIFLPCRHLCSCNSCEAYFTSCPVCESLKEGSLEVFWV